MFYQVLPSDIHWFGVFAARSGAAGNTIGEKKKEKNRWKVESDFFPKLIQ